MSRHKVIAWLFLILTLFLSLVISRARPFAARIGAGCTFVQTSFAPGDLDPSFGESGKTTALFFGDSAFAYAAALQPDGKIVATGGNSTTRNFSLARFLPNGSVDTSFGTAGRVSTGFGSNYDLAFAQAVVLQSDGKIVAGGSAYDINGIPEFAIVRYLPNGSLDSSFGSSGKVTTSFSGRGDQLKAIVIQ